MNPIAQEAVGSILRWALALGAGYLVKAGIWTGSNAETYVMAASLAILSLAWSQRKNWTNRVKLLVALMMPKGSTEQQVVDHISDGLPVPTVTTPPTTIPGVPKLAAILFACALAGSMMGCASIHTNVSPVADVANAGAKIEDSAHAIFVSAQSAEASKLITRVQLDTVAIAVNKIGHLGLDLKASLDAYNVVKAAGKDLTVQRSAVQQVLAAITQAMADVGKAIPPGTVQQVDQLATSILGVVAQVQVGVGL